MDGPGTVNIQCSYCFGSVPAEELECPRCGAPLDKSDQSSDFQGLSVEEFIEEANERLIKAGTSAAELAFGVGCTLEVLVAGLLMVIIFIAITRELTILAVVALILTLISILVSSVLASRAQKIAIRSTFKRDIAPEIKEFIDFHEIDQEQFDDKAAEILPTDSPLIAFLAGQENQ